MPIPLKEQLEEAGWTVHENYCFKKFPRNEIVVEFCTGDFCVGIYGAEENLLEPKIRCKDLASAIITSVFLEDKYDIRYKIPIPFEK